MSRSTKVAVASTAAGLLALGGGLSIAGQAAADPTTSPSSSPSASPSNPGPGKGGHRGGPGRGSHDSDLAEKLAEKLNVDQPKVTEALKAVREANKPTSRPPTGASPSERPSRPDPATRDAAQAKGLAEKLGVAEATVTKALEEIRAEQQTERAAALKSRLDAAVKAGTLTQAEADAVTKAVEKGVIGGR
ncbi:hypothetical protein [Micropruina sp.]|uniref:hypothetical protein n=1 Tax=Micropruina sp. TaxID=2737536 RepID=UPI0039E3202E